jgi:glycosyltransferase involved in cell wall biosynthesis
MTVQNEPERKDVDDLGTAAERGARLRIAWVHMSSDQAAGYGKLSAYLPSALELAGGHALPWRSYDWDWRIAVGGPRAWLLGKGEGVVQDIMWLSMFEARPLPTDWAGVLNRCAAIWTPATWNVEVYRESGVTRPMVVAGFGVNERYFHPMTRADGDDHVYTFLWAGASLGNGVDLGDRKGGEMVVQAFRKLDLPDARLVLKAGPGSAVKRVGGDPRIALMAYALPEQDYATLLATADCFVYPSHGEGFGLQPLEAMAVGLPVIAPAWSGLSDFIQPDVAVVLPTRGETKAHLYNHIYGHDCVWADISVDDVADRMRWCYDHREEAKGIGCRAAAWVAERWTWQRAGEVALEAILALPKPWEGSYGHH